jgi:hypothetical protein
MDHPHSVTCIAISLRYINLHWTDSMPKDPTQGDEALLIYCPSPTRGPHVRVPVIPTSADPLPTQGRI